MQVLSRVGRTSATFLKRISIPLLILGIGIYAVYFAAQQFPAWQHAISAIGRATFDFLQRFYLPILLIGLPGLIVCVAYRRSILGIVQRYKYPIAAILLFVFSGLVLWGYAYEWTGFGSYQTVTTTREAPSSPQGTTVTITEGFQRGKTLWDWLQLLIVPIVLAIGGYVFNRTEKAREAARIEERAEIERKRAEQQARVERERAEQQARVERERAARQAQVERDIAVDNQRETTLQTYFDRMSELVIDKKLRDLPQDDAAWAVAQARTSTTLSRLDAHRTERLVQFLIQAQLLNKKQAGIDLGGVNLKGARLLWANLKGANLEGANLEEAVLFQANLEEAVLFQANLKEATFQGANLKGALLLRANLEGALLMDANLEGANLLGANLEGANLLGANLEGANLLGPNLKGALLLRANLERAFLMDANLEGANLEGANLEGALLANANLKQAKLWAINLEGAVLHRANLEGAFLMDANLKGATFQGAHLRWAYLKGVDLRYVADLTPEQLQEAFTDEKTQLPDYLEAPSEQKAVSQPSEADAAGEHEH